jgi:hypothetical protein
VACVTNLTPDHLDRYKDMAAYAAAKKRIFKNQAATDYAVVNARDPATVQMAAGEKPTVYTFGHGMPERGAPLGRSLIAVTWTGARRLPVAQPGPARRAHVDNAMVAVLAARKKFLISRLGDLGLLAVLGLVYSEFHTWRFSDLFAAAGQLRDAQGAGMGSAIGLIGILLVASRHGFGHLVPSIHRPHLPIEQDHVRNHFRREPHVASINNK